MALRKDIICIKCGKEKTVIYSGYTCPMMCSQCQENKEKAKKDAHMNELSSLSIEERLAKIESILYDAPWVSMIRKRDSRF